ncbi:MAG: 50S ribosomal protein L18 [Candidatus Heimdallarchaeota archaeon]|nr:MAG: 50S ribosomal protein L18 [Candidatus Heimdallarchaeota archaeon]
MARNARYRIPFRRRREGKTNYHLRRRLVRSNRIRAVVRVTNNHCLVQFIKARITGDITLSASHSRELKSFKWNSATSNLPSAYLVGFLAGLKAKKVGISRAILDIGLNPPVYGSRIFAALKGIVDAGIEVPHSNKIFPATNRLNGTHIADFAKNLKESDEELFNKQFSKYNKQKIDPVKIPLIFDKTKKEIQDKYH